MKPTLNIKSHKSKLKGRRDMHPANTNERKVEVTMLRESKLQSKGDWRETEAGHRRMRWPTL